MNNMFNVVVVSTLVLLSQSVFAAEQALQEPAKPAMKMDHSKGGMDKGMGAMGGMGGDMDPAKMMEHLKMKQDHQLKMHDLSNKILAETDPKKQQELKDQQLELMKAHHMHMMKMHKMMGKHKM